MKWLRKWIKNWLREESDVQKFLGGNDGSTLSEYQKGVYLKKLTQQDGWALLKGIFMETMRIQNLGMQVESKGKKDSPTGAIYAKGLALASVVLIEIEEIDLQKLKGKQNELDEQANQDKLDALAESKEED